MGNMAVRKVAGGGVAMQRIQLKNVAFMPGKAPSQQSPNSSIQPGVGNIGSGPHLKNMNVPDGVHGKVSPIPQQ